MTLPGANDLTGETASGRRLALQLFALSFAALFLELMVIRWVPSTLRFVAYYANLMLISSFLGLGIGTMISRRGWNLFRFFPAILSVNVALLALCRFVVMPSTDSEVRFYLTDSHALSYLALLGIFILNTVVFVPLGERIGQIFSALPNLRAYTWDLWGSLAGTLCFGFFSLRFFSPLAGFAAVMVIYLCLIKGRARLWSLIGFAITLSIVSASASKEVVWSPYYYITVHPQSGNPAPVSEPVANLRTMQDPPIYSVSVNQDFYQEHGTIDAARYTPGSAQAKYVEENLREAYLLPYKLRPDPSKVLVVGAGGGIDVQAAVLSGASHVDAAEIDRRLVDLSRKFNASGIYDDPKVQVHIDDARAFFRRASLGYDLVVFGFLDSQALFSYSSNIRLDGFIYTVESIRSAYSLLSADGMLSLSFVTPKPWLMDKLHAMVKEGTGTEPLIYVSGIQTIFLTPKTPGGHWENVPAKLGRFERLPDAPVPQGHVDVATDDWPFLYLNNKGIPQDYLLIIGTLVAVSLIAVFIFRGKQLSTNDGHFLFLGLGFMLLETKSITDCSLYFGTTWLVTMIVLAGVLLMVLAANLVAMRIKRFSPWLYLPLFLSLAMVFLVPRDTVLGWAFGPRLAWAILAVPLPIFFAGLIFSTTFRDALNPAALFGTNLVGATIGGFAEYLSMATGTKALALLVVAAYVASLVSKLIKRPAV